ncbi:MAG: hypothetical protein IID55_11075 [Proteobacteria bacterium]|nr:hypothetical protein [Pseudomonadota bacterium]
MGGVVRRVGGALANLVPNSRPVYRERLEARAEPSLSIPQGDEDAVAEAEVVLSLDARRKKRGGGGTRDLESPREPLSDRQARSLDALRKKKSA